MRVLAIYIRAADGLVVGASVRNGYFPALTKRFYERITYILGFGRDLRGKHVLAVGAVGLASDGSTPAARSWLRRSVALPMLPWLILECARSAWYDRGSGSGADRGGMVRTDDRAG